MSTALVFSLPKPQIPFLPSAAASSSWSGLRRNPPAPPKTLTPSLLRSLCSPRKPRTAVSVASTIPTPSPFPPSPNGPHPRRSSTKAFAGRSKKKPGGPSPGRIEGNAEVRRRAKEGARKRSRRLAESYFYRHAKPGADQADAFTDEELQMIGLGYDRMVRFMEKDDPRLRHPHDWYKYGHYGPYSWRGIVVGNPIRGRFTDERVSIIGEVRDHEEWEKIERFEMAADFTRRVKSLDRGVGFRHFWVFVRHPKWKAAELPWQQWTLVAEVVLEAGKQRLDKWSLMGRLGNNARALITQCAAWMRPDIIYVRRPVYQCRFEPQDDFFRLLGPLIDPETEGQYLFELANGEGRVELCTYFAGLCKIVRISPKAFVDDVVNAFEKLSDEGKSRCLEFLLTNHPMELLHPYTKEWKAKLEEMELGCDAPDESDGEDDGSSEVVDWVEDDGDGEAEDEEDVVIDVGDEGDEELLGADDEVSSPEESEEYWDEQWKKAMRSSEAMETLVKKSIQVSNEAYKSQFLEGQKQQRSVEEQGERAEAEAATAAKPMREEWAQAGYRGLRRRIEKSKIPPELFLRAAVRPFTYRNLVKEIVLMRHAIVDKEVTWKQ
ncbi:hypothetical protein Taro_025093 [Colocasia esculenta]|uniref:Uncharacterized protein n=1 Tax=Colocasia esculenta TaxID=4460 RepID=A0A843VFJ5_COLES|nr:hypothetical protein [Colocasia esculenta]